MRPRSPITAPSLGVALSVLLLVGAGAASAGAAPHTPCPTGGQTLRRDAAPNVRVWREGTTLRACTRRPGQRRYVRTLGSWSSATRIALDEGTVAWTTRRTTESGPVDGVTTIDVRTGKRWLQTQRGAVATDASTPASDDRVLRLVTGSRATAWVSARGIVAAAVRRLDGNPATLYGDGVPGTEPFRVGRRYFLGDAGPAAAPAVAQGLRLAVGGDGDECGGTDDFQVRVPAFGGRPDLVFRYASEDWTSTTC